MNFESESMLHTLLPLTLNHRVIQLPEDLKTPGALFIPAYTSPSSTEPAPNP